MAWGLITGHAVNQGPASPAPQGLHLPDGPSCPLGRLTAVIDAVRNLSISDHLARNGVINVRQQDH